MKITVETEVHAPLAVVWAAWTTPDDITKWNFAIDAWRCPRAEIDLAIGGKFHYRMEARDGTDGFDFEGVFTKVSPMSSIQYKLGDDRHVTIEFRQTAGGVEVIETFDTEDENSAEQQRLGWQCILDNFKKHVEGKSS